MRFVPLWYNNNFVVVEAVCAPSGTTTLLLFPSGSLFVFRPLLPHPGQSEENNRKKQRARTPQRGVNYGDATTSLPLRAKLKGTEGEGKAKLYPLWSTTTKLLLQLCFFSPLVCVIAPLGQNRGERHTVAPRREDKLFPSGSLLCPLGATEGRDKLLLCPLGATKGKDNVVPKGQQERGYGKAKLYPPPPPVVARRAKLLLLCRTPKGGT